MKIHIKIYILVLLLCCTVHSYAQMNGKYHAIIPDVKNPPTLVNDFANMLTAEEELILEQKLLNFEQQTSNQVTIVTVKELGGLDVSEFAVELGRKWDIGQESKKNGVLVLAAKDERKINISPARGLQGALPDIICGRINRENIVPHFKAGNFYDGFNEGIDKIIAATKGEYTNDAYAKEVSINPLFIMLAFFCIFLLFIYIKRKSRNIYASRRGYRYDTDTWLNLPSSGSGWFNTGSWGNDNSDSGFGGFGGFGGGGGGFDGGGASDSW